MKQGRFYAFLMALLMGCGVLMMSRCYIDNDTLSADEQQGRAVVAASFGTPGLQPYERGTASVQNYFQDQYGNTCGQTCIYIIARYYGVVGPNTPKLKYLLSSGYWYSKYLDSYSDCVASAYYYPFTYRWLDYVPGGLPITSTTLARGALTEIEDLKHSSNNVPVFNRRYSNVSYVDETYVGSLVTYDENGIAIGTSQSDRLDYITAKYLDNGIPVVIHLERDGSDAGHYVVLAGCENDTVYYVDPNGDYSDPVDHLDVVSKSTFLGDTKWYSPAEDPADRDAYWDGKWYAFYRN